MKKFLEYLCSMPVILLVLYFIPFLGICLILFRYYIYKEDKFFKAPVTLIIVSLLLLIPKLLELIINLSGFGIKNVPYLEKVISSDIYTKLVSYSKTLIIIGVITLIVSYLLRELIKKMTSKVSNGFNNYVKKQQEQEYKIAKENDLIMQEKREKAKNTHAVICPNCGHTNLLTEEYGRCKYCRSNIG